LKVESNGNTNGNTNDHIHSSSSPRKKRILSNVKSAKTYKIKSNTSAKGPSVSLYHNNNNNNDLNANSTNNNDDSINNNNGSSASSSDIPTPARESPKSWFNDGSPYTNIHVVRARWDVKDVSKFSPKLLIYRTRNSKLKLLAKTPTVKNSANPEWNELFHVDFGSSAENDVYRIVIVNEDIADIVQKAKK